MPSEDKRTIYKRPLIFVDKRIYELWCKKWGKKYVNDVIVNELQCDSDGHDWPEMFDSYKEVEGFVCGK